MDLLDFVVTYFPDATASMIGKFVRDCEDAGGMSLEKAVEMLAPDMETEKKVSLLEALNDLDVSNDVVVDE